MAGIDLVRVPYKGQGPMFTALMSGEIQLTITSGAALLPHCKAGRMRALAVTSAKPSNMFPGIPTIAATVPGYESETVFAVLAPAATPATVINLLQRNIADVLNRPDVKENCSPLGTRSSRYAGVPCEHDESRHGTSRKSHTGCRYSRGVSVSAALATLVHSPS